jgi:O-antigen/teichoic acid export membrane protein
MIKLRLLQKLLDSIKLYVRENFLLLDLVFVKVVDMGFYFFLLSFLSASEMAEYAIALGLVAVISVIFVSPENSIFRFRDDMITHGTLRGVYSVIYFWYIIQIFIITVLLFSLHQLSVESMTLAVTILLITKANQLTEFAKFEYRFQDIILAPILITLLTRFIFVLAAILFFVYLDFSIVRAFIHFSFVITAISMCLVAVTLNVQLPNARHIKDTFSLFSQHGLWLYLNGSITNLLYNIDVAFLYRLPPEKIVGYSVALKIGNTIQIFSNLMSAKLNFRYEQMDNAAAFKRSLFLNVIGLFFIGLLIIFYFKFFMDSHEIYFFTPETYLIISLISIGSIFLSISRPYINILNFRGNVKSIFLRLYIPIAIISLILYAIAGLAESAILMATFSMVGYILFSFLIVKNAS